MHDATRTDACAVLAAEVVAKMTRPEFNAWRHSHFYTSNRRQAPAQWESTRG